MILKLGMYHWGLKLYKVYISDEPGLTMTYFMARSNRVTCTFEWGKLTGWECSVHLTRMSDLYSGD